MKMRCSRKKRMQGAGSAGRKTKSENMAQWQRGLYNVFLTSGTANFLFVFLNKDLKKNLLRNTFVDHD